MRGWILAMAERITYFGLCKAQAGDDQACVLLVSAKDCAPYLDVPMISKVVYCHCLT